MRWFIAVAWMAAGCGGSHAGTSSPPADGGATAASEGGIPIVDAGADGTTLAPGYSMTIVYAGTATAYGPMAIDSTSAYFVVEDPSTGEDLVKVPLAGGSAVVLATDPNDFGGFAVDGSNLYWTDFGNGGRGLDGGATAPDGDVMTTPLAGGSASAVVTGTSAAAVAVDGTNVYWLDSVAGTLSAVPKGGGQATVLASGQSGAQQIVLDADNLYWSVNGSAGIGQLRTVPKSGGTPTQLASYECSIGALAVHAAYVYWTCSAGDLMRTPVAGGASTALAMTQDTFEGPIAVDDAAVYWTTLDSTVVKLPLVGGAPPQGATPTVLYAPSQDTNVNDATAIALDSTGLYVLLYGGSLAKITPP